MEFNNYMKRLIDLELKNWAVSSHRKPLLMRGARQVGKTHAVRKLGATFTHFVEINFEKQKHLIAVFEKDLDPVRIINTLVSLSGHVIKPGETLLFFDEIQNCPNAITALRYFYEEMPDLHVIAAGSLLDFVIEEIGVPVGRVAYCYVYPVSFMEYLAAAGYYDLFNMVVTHSIEQPIEEIFHIKLFDLLGQYMLIGGMPQVIAESLEKQDIPVTHRLQHAILDAYRDDFPKYAKKFQIKYVDLIFNQAVHFLGGLFQYKDIPGNYQKRELAPALDLLIKAGVIHKIYQSAGNGIPLGAEANLEKFKIIFLDIALTQVLLGYQPSSWLIQPLETFINKGNLAEGFVGQELLAYSHSYAKTDLYYWHRSERNSNAEVDYLIQLGQYIIPIEVKGGKGSSLKSLHLFLAARPKTPFSVRFSVHNYSIVNKLHSYPLYSIAGFLAGFDEELRKKLQWLITDKSTEA